jgi:peptidoglycan hydrolase CwlO-like protein
MGWIMSNLFLYYKDMIRNNSQNILLGIVVILAAWNIFTTNSVKTDVQGYKDKIQALQVQVDSAQAVNNVIDTKIDSVKEKVVHITEEINHIDNNITIIKKQTDEKVNRVDSYSANELEQFFADRYNKGTN